MLNIDLKCDRCKAVILTTKITDDPERKKALQFIKQRQDMQGRDLCDACIPAWSEKQKLLTKQREKDEEEFFTGKDIKGA